MVSQIYETTQHRMRMLQNKERAQNTKKNEESLVLVGTILFEVHVYNNNIDLIMNHTDYTHTHCMYVPYVYVFMGL